MNNNPFPEGSRSYKIWEKNNNPKSNQFIKSVLSKGRITKKEERLMKEAVNVQS